MVDRPSIVRLRELLRLQKYKNVINDDGSVAVPASEVFSELSSAMDVEIRLKPKNIYTILKLDRHNVHTEILEFYNIAHEPPLKINISLDDSLQDKISFTVNVADIWMEIQTEKVSYNFKNRGLRTIGTLKRHSWTNFLFDEIFKITKIQCPLAFKRSKSSDDGYAVTVDGYCPECDCQFQGRIVNQPTRQDDSSILMECCIEYYDASFAHRKKRQLKGSKRIEVATELVEGKTLPTIWRRKEANRLMDIGDKEPPHLFTGHVLRKARQERLDNLLGIKTSDVFESLQLLKYSARHEGAIRSIGLDPLFVHYWTNEQIAVYEKYHQVLYIDATGSLVKSIKLANGELSSHTYLYQAVAKIEEKTGPVFQMISTVQNTNAITYWLTEFLRIGSLHKSTFPMPKEVVTDFDRALIGAVVKAFTKQNSLADYLSECFNLIQYGGTPHNAFCYLRLDICHFMNMVSNWKCWRGLPSRVRQFYIRSMAVLRNQSTLHGIETQAKAIFITALNSNQAPGNSTDNARNLLTTSIQGITVEDEYLNFNEHDTESTDNSDDNESGMQSINIFEWVSDLFKTCEREVSLEEETIDVNGFYCPGVAKKLKLLLPYFPMFSEVMSSIFGYGSKRPTSAAVESEFNDLKHRVLKDVTRPMRADKFVSRHLSSFSGKLKIARASQKLNDSLNEPCVKTEIDHEHPETHQRDQSEIEYIQNTTATPSNEEIISDKIELYQREVTNNNNAEPERSDDEQFNELSELQSELNWRNKNRRKQTHKYIDPLPQFDPTLRSMLKLPIIVNGNFCLNVHDKGKIFVITNTCGFDSMCQILATCLTNNEKYKQATVEIHSALHECARTLISDGLKIKFYKQRANLFYLLHSSPGEETSTAVIKINAEANIINLARQIFAETPSCITTFGCEICGTVDKQASIEVGINHNIMRAKGFQKLDEAIENGFFKPQTMCCNRKRYVTRTYAPQILVDTDIGDRRKTKLNDIPLELDLLERSTTKKYVLAGVVAYRGTFKLNSLGHYTAYTKMHVTWMSFDGNFKKGKSEIVNDNEAIHAHLCIYTI